MGKSGIELKKLTKEEIDAEKEAVRQAKTAYFKREDAQKERKIKKAIVINVIIFALSIATLITMGTGVIPVQVGIILLVIFSVSSTLVSKRTTKKIR